ncbi:MAG TPA: 50S ribosomal protein L9 [Polyangia bacterium]|jgi:large subunit ribosomal protein L9
MQVILREDMENLGKSGEVVTVKSGFGRNYLIPQGLAVTATEEDVARVAHEKRVIAARNAKLQKDAQAEADRLNQVSVSIAVSVGEEDKLYGSVTAKDIAEAYQEKGVTVDSKKLVLGEPIKSLGLTEVPVKLAHGVTATLKVWVVKKEEKA